MRKKKMKAKKKMPGSEISISELDEDYDQAYPEERLSGNAGRKYIPYRSGGKYRSVKLRK